MATLLCADAKCLNGCGQVPDFSPEDLVCSDARRLAVSIRYMHTRIHITRFAKGCDCWNRLQLPQRHLDRQWLRGAASGARGPGAVRSVMVKHI